MRLFGVDNQSVIWDSQVEAQATVDGMRAAGMDSCLMMQGSSSLTAAVAPVFEAARFPIWAGVNQDWRNGAGTWFDPTSPPAATLANAKTVANTMADRLRGFRCIRGYNYIDEPHADQAARVALAARAIREADPHKAPTSVQIGTSTRIGPNYTQAQLRQLWIDVYPASTNNSDGALTMAGYGLPNMTFEQYIDQAMAAAQWTWRTHTLWIILQTHAAPGALLRRPSVREVREQFWRALMYFPSGVGWFIWRPQSGESWTGLRDDAEHKAVVTDLHARVQRVKALFGFAYRQTSSGLAASSGMIAHGRTPGAGGARELFVWCNASGSSVAPTFTGTGADAAKYSAGYLRNTYTNEIRPVGQAWGSYAPGDGGVWEWTAASSGAPAAHVVVPDCPVRDFTADNEEDRWPEHPLNPLSDAYNPSIVPVGRINASDYAHDLQAAYAALPAAGGTVVLSPGVTYTGTLRVEQGKGHVSFVCDDPDNRAVVRTTIRLIPTPHAEYYHGNPTNTDCNSITMMTKRHRVLPTTSYHQEARVEEFFPGAPRGFKGTFFKNLIIDGNDRSNTQINGSMVARVMFDNCQFQGFQWDGTSGHPGHYSGNSMQDEIHFRDCLFRGRYPVAAGSNRARYGLYIDGGHGCTFVRCTVESNRYSSALLVAPVNDDYSHPVNHGSEILPEFQRLNQYTVFFDCTFGGQTYSNVAALAGRQALYTYSRTSGAANANFTEVQDKPNKASIYALANVGGRQDQSSPCGVRDMVGEYSGTLAPFQYFNEWTVISHCKIHGTLRLAGIRSTWANENLENPPKIRPLIGRIVVDDVVYGDTTPDWAAFEGGTTPAYPSGAYTGVQTSNVQTTANIASAPDPSVVPKRPSRLAFTQQPLGGAVGTLAQQPVVEVRDGAGQRLTGYSGAVTLSLVNPGGATLTGPTTVSASDGIAAFSGVGIGGAGGTGLVFQAAVSDPSDVVARSASVSALPPTTDVTVVGAVFKDNASGLGVTTDVSAIPWQAGDLDVMILRKEPSTFNPATHIANWGTSPSLPFTLLANSQQVQPTTNQHTSMVFSRVPSEAPTSYTINFTSGNGGRTNIIYVRLRGVAASGALTWVAGAVASGSGVPVIPSQTTVDDKDVFIQYAAVGATTTDWTPDAGWTTVESVTDRNLYAQYQAFPTGGSATGEMSPGANASSWWTTGAVRVTAGTNQTGVEYTGVGTASTNVTATAGAIREAVGVGTASTNVTASGAGRREIESDGVAAVLVSASGDGTSTPVVGVNHLGSGTASIQVETNGVGIREVFGVGTADIGDAPSQPQATSGRALEIGRRSKVEPGGLILG